MTDKNSELPPISASAEIDQEQNKPQKNTPPLVTRRTLFRRLGVAVVMGTGLLGTTRNTVLAADEAGDADGSASAGPALITTPQAAGESATEYPTAPYTQELRSGVIVATVLFDTDGTPIKYNLNDGQEVVFDRQKAKDLRAKAMSNGEDMILDINVNFGVGLSVAQNEVLPTGVEHQVLKELPRGVLSAAELAPRGLELINPSNMELFVSPNTFNKGELFEGIDGIRQKMVLLLLNGPMIDRAYLTDPKLEKYQNLLNARAEKMVGYRQQRLIDAQQYMQQKNSRTLSTSS